MDEHEIELSNVIALVCVLARERIDRLSEIDPDSETIETIRDALGNVDPAMIDERLAEEWWNS